MSEHADYDSEYVDYDSEHVEYRSEYVGFGSEHVDYDSEYIDYSCEPYKEDAWYGLSSLKTVAAAVPAFALSISVTS